MAKRTDRRDQPGRDFTVAEQRAWLRTLLIAVAMQRDPEGVPLLQGPVAQQVKTRGRPQSAAPSKWLSEYNFDVEHFEALRALGFDNVPPSKAALLALVNRLYPNDPTATRVGTVKKALQRE